MQVKTNIGNKTGFILGLVLLLVITPSLIFTQTSVNLEDYDGCKGEFSLPLFITDFEDVSAFSIGIEIDTAVVELIDLANVHQDLASGNLEAGVNESDEILAITWVSMNPVNIEDAKLFEIRFQLKNGFVSLDFTENCEIVRSDLSVIEDVEYTNGSLLALGSLTIDPWTNEIAPGEDAVFALPGEYTEFGYQWQEKKPDEGWMNVNENGTYSGVQTPVLTIHNVPLSFNNRLYRCMISNTECAEPTNAAELNVSVGLDEKDEKEAFDIEAYPNPAYEKLSYIIKGVNNFSEAEVFLTDIYGQVLVRKKNIIDGENYLRLDHLPSGFYFLRLLNENKMIQTIKVLHL